MNNIVGANVVILKWPTVGKADNYLENHTYPITAATQSQNLAPTKVYGSKNFQPTSKVAKPAAENVERPIAQQSHQILHIGLILFTVHSSPTKEESMGRFYIGGHRALTDVSPASQDVCTLGQAGG